MLIAPPAQDLMGYIPVVVLALAIVAFACAPLVIFLTKNHEFSKRDIAIVGLQCAWLLIANAICALSTVEYCFERFGRNRGLWVTVLITSMGGTIALGLYEVVLNRRLTIGRIIERKLSNFLTIETISDNKEGEEK